MANRIHDSRILTLLHFDYPYYAEPYDGLRDEIRGNVWIRNGGVKLAGSEIPADEIVTGVPKFGYRCLHSTNEQTYIESVSPLDTIIGDEGLNITFHIYPTAAQIGKIATFLDVNGNE